MSETTAAAETTTDAIESSSVNAESLTVPKHTEEPASTTGEEKKEEDGGEEKKEEGGDAEDAEEKEDAEEEEEEEEDAEFGALPDLPASSKGGAYVMGNKARTGARETAFYQVLNVSEGWHRNRTLSKKEGQKLLQTKELLQERLDGKAYVAVEFYGHGVEGAEVSDTNFRVRVDVDDTVASLKSKVCEHIEVFDERKIELLCQGKVISERDKISEAFKKAYEREKVTFCKPYIGLVWASPKGL
jgi:hypothetical protein